MPEKTSIEWTDATWNPIRGCTRVSEGCRNCYAERIAARFSGPGRPYEGLAKMTPSGPRWTGKIVTVPGHLEDPIRWKEPRMIFVNSMSDLFHESLSFDDVLRVIHVMERAPQHIYQILTKRADRMREFINEVWGDRTPPNWWMGVSVEDEPNAKRRIPHLLNTWASVRWISGEPLLGPLTLRGDIEETGDSFSFLEGFTGCDPEIPALDWVVVGGESGPGARPMHPDWVRSLRDQCVAASVPFFFKQWGAWAPTELRAGGDLGGDLRRGFAQHLHAPGNPEGYFRRGDAYVSRLGKKAAGRLLDGREWNEYPASLSSAGEKRIVEAACANP